MRADIGRFFEVLPNLIRCGKVGRVSSLLCGFGRTRFRRSPSELRGCRHAAP